MRCDDRVLLTADEMQHVDAVTQERFGIPGTVLMENAGQKAWAVVAKELADRNDEIVATIVFLAGNGNNGGDALVMARQCLVEGVHRPVVITLAEALRGAAREQWERLHALGLSRCVWEVAPAECRNHIATADVLVDGISGTGLSEPLRPGVGELVSVINDASGTRIAVDVPSGMRDGGAVGEPHIVANMTISTGHEKRLLYAPARRGAAGTIVSVDPGFPPLSQIAELTTSTRRLPTDMTALQRRRWNPPPDAHKGARGRVLIIAGAPGTEGAAILAAESACAAGAGMVRVGTTAAAIPPGLARAPGVMWRTGLPTEDDFDWADAVVCGPGWTDATLEDITFVLRVAGARSLPTVLDAAALRLLKRATAPEAHGAKLVLTPHPGELAALADVTVPEVLARPFAVLTSVANRWLPSTAPVILLKASATICRAGNGRFSVIDGRPALGVAGSGDVLSGIIGARLAMAPRPSSVADVEDRVLSGALEHLLRGRQLSRRGTFSAGTLAQWSPEWEDVPR